MTPEFPGILRFTKEQKAEIQAAQQIRDEANALRARVSGGSYDDNDLDLFWKLTSKAGIVLRISNPQLGERANLGDKFFSSVSRERRRPKLTNFLRALTVINDVANERLQDIESKRRLGDGPDTIDGDTEANNTDENLLLLSLSLAQLAREEIIKLDDERPNDPEAIAKRAKQREILVLFAVGFERIARALGQPRAQDNGIKRAHEVEKALTATRRSFNEWWKTNSLEVVDWSIRIPFITAGVAALNLAGANMAAATPGMFALVGGAKVVDIIKGKKPK